MYLYLQIVIHNNHRYTRTSTGNRPSWQSWVTCTGNRRSVIHNYHKRFFVGTILQFYVSYLQTVICNNHRYTRTSTGNRPSWQSWVTCTGNRRSVIHNYHKCFFVGTILQFYVSYLFLVPRLLSLYLHLHCTCWYYFIL